MHSSGEQKHNAAYKKQVLRVYETAMSMTELVKDKNNFQTAPKRRCVGKTDV